MVAVAAVLATAQARAQAPPDPDAIIEHGIQLREQGHDDQALLEFHRAYAILPSPRASAQIGLAEQALGQWVEADRYLEKALAAKRDAWIESRRSALDAAGAAVLRHLGTLEIRGGIDGAEVRLDGTLLGVLPLGASQHVEAGTRALEVRAAGYYPVSRTIIVAPGATSRETVELVPLAPPTPTPSPTAVPIDAPLAPARAPATYAPATATQKTLGWVGVAISGAAVATGAVALLLRGSEITSYNNDASCPGTAASGAQPGPCADRISAASTWLTVGIVGFVAAGVLGATSVTLLATAPGRERSRTLACRAGIAGIGCAGSF